MDNPTYQYRTLARIIITAESPLRIGSGEKDLITDSLVIKDANGLPYIPGSSVAGVIRNSLSSSLADRVFGLSEGNERHGSEIIVSDALLVYEDNSVAEGLFINSDLISLYNDLPLRQHVRIGSRGTAIKGGKFDEQVVFRGTRFCFEMELCSSEDGMPAMESILQTLAEKGFRLGGGSRRGFGAIRIHSIMTASLDLKKHSDLTLYLQKSSSLNARWSGWNAFPIPQPSDRADEWKEYTLSLKANDFFLFASGSGDNNADITPAQETIIEWHNSTPIVKERIILIPASSVKGAIAHRTAFHYNRIKGIYADQVSDISNHIGASNKAVQVLFGSEGDANHQNRRGLVLFTDVYMENTKPKILNHIAVDPFTSGTIDGAKFDELVTWAKDIPFSVKILVQENAVNEKDILQAFRCALQDICHGDLPLGGGTMRGHGVFYGTLN